MEPESPQKKSSKTPWIVLLILILLILAAAAYWYFVLRASTELTPTVTSTKVSTESAKPATEAAKTPDDTALITAALVTKTGIAADVIAVTVSQNDGKYAKGTVSSKGEEVGGGYFLAVKINNDWVIVFDGQSTPDCSSVNPHNFPVALALECLDSNGEIVTR